MTSELRATVLQLYEEGTRIADIARRTALHRKQVSRILAHEDIKNPPSTGAIDKLPEILELRSQGVTLTEIGRRLGFSRKAISRALQKRKKGPKK